ncbi:unnamed protein product [Bursaphelenchus okinawaensis]|uniref:Mos1 transposase HTH domain-containing protein n=1 Tax=Bursaphelenchus okinawaensis TaxID=465554 RepID=A0A811JTX8_9BILA|nr:unnamed protein product [Bursaphelenchus okinawaensis]CAG9083088.1 unnamed protein product [Bursaphelenchus okinawaensis]
MEKTILRACILYDFKRGLKASECLKSINEALGNDAVTRSTVHAWYKRFREGGESLEDDDRAGRSSKLSKEVLKAAMEKKPDITTRELATKLRSDGEGEEGRSVNLGEATGGDDEMYSSHLASLIREANRGSEEKHGRQSYKPKLKVPT